MPVCFLSEVEWRAQYALILFTLQPLHYKTILILIQAHTVHEHTQTNFEENTGIQNVANLSRHHQLKSISANVAQGSNFDAQMSGIKFWNGNKNLRPVYIKKNSFLRNVVTSILNFSFIEGTH
jgi:hypothetical protein